jgi:imidazolonepropionase-like amidohydrolase
VPLAYVEEWKRPALLRRVSAEDARLQFEQCLTVVRELHQAGVTILAGTDVGTAFQVPGISLHDELSLLVKAGLSELEALQAATRDPARTFKIVDQGTIEIGMRADVVLLDGSPLEGIDNIRRIRTVVAGGRVLERSELDAMLGDIQKAASQWTGTPTR